MTVYKVFFVLLSVVIFTSKYVYSRPSENDSLRMILTLFRHGTRSPVQSFPTDPHADYPWLNGFGELQAQGFEQLYQLGRNMRRRYKFFIPEDTATMKRSIYAVSSCVQRCIDSTQSFLTGFLKTSNGSETRRQPVPIHVIPPDQDTYILQNKTCQKVKAIAAQEKDNSDSILAALYREGTALQKFISTEVGEPISSLYDTAVICDNLEVYNAMGLKQPDWAYQIFPDRVRAFLLGFLLSYTATPELKHIRGGAILSEYLQKMKAKRDGTMKHNRKLFFYSGHDLTQINLFNALGMTEQVRRRPDLGSAVVFELHKSKEFWKDLELRMFHYENSSIENPVELAIPNCAEPCSLTKFEQTVRHLLLDDYDAVCST